MISDKGGRHLLAFCAVLLVYFLSESVLRQAVVSRFESDKIKPEVILARLPASLKEKVGYNLELTRLRDALRGGKKDEKTIIATQINLAIYTKDKAESEKIFKSIIRGYPNKSESVQAYCYFLLKKNSPDSVSLKRFHSYVMSCDPKDRLYLWQSGFSKIQKDQQPLLTQLNYLEPLLDIKPDYKEYLVFYEGICKLAGKLGDEEKVEKADTLRKACLDLPSYDIELMKTGTGGVDAKNNAKTVKSTDKKKKE